MAGKEEAEAGDTEFLAWDTYSRRRIDMVERKDHGDEVIAHEFDYSVKNQARNVGGKGWPPAARQVSVQASGIWGLHCGASLWG